jgi:hypothetical protein
VSCRQRQVSLRLGVMVHIVSGTRS